MGITGITASMATQQWDTAAKWREHPVAQPDSVKGNPWGEPACVEKCPAWGLGLALRRICLGGLCPVPAWRLKPLPRHPDRS